MIYSSGRAPTKRIVTRAKAQRGRDGQGIGFGFKVISEKGKRRPFPCGVSDGCVDLQKQFSVKDFNIGYARFFAAGKQGAVLKKQNCMPKKYIYSAVLAKNPKEKKPLFQQRGLFVFGKTSLIIASRCSY